MCWLKSSPNRQKPPSLHTQHKHSSLAPCCLLPPSLLPSLILLIPANRAGTSSSAGVLCQDEGGRGGGRGCGHVRGEGGEER